MLTKAYDAVVAGSGPAGVATVGALLHFNKSARIAWVDPDFVGGRVSRQYRDVSSNTKVKLFLDYAEAFDPFQDVVRTSSKGFLRELQELDPDQGCRLGYAADMLEELIHGLRRSKNIVAMPGKISEAVYESGKSVWAAKSEEDIEAKKLVLCTGSSPSTIKLPTSSKELNLDTTLDRQKLKKILPRDTDATVGIVGTSHSAIVVIMNLYELASTTHPNLKIKWFVRSDLLYAEYMDGWILRDNTGLKGASADFAREHLEPDKLPSSPISKYLSVVKCPDARDESMRPALSKCSHIVQAIGYTRDPLPQINIDGKAVSDVAYDASTGSLLGSDHAKLPHAYGAGIAFPQRVTDPAGNTEYAVGMWKFVKHLKQVVPAWT